MSKNIGISTVFVYQGNQVTMMTESQADEQIALCNWKIMHNNHFKKTASMILWRKYLSQLMDAKFRYDDIPF